MIRHRNAARAAELTEVLGVTARSLLDHGIIDRIIAEPVDAATRPRPFLDEMTEAMKPGSAACWQKGQRCASPGGSADSG